MTSSDSVFLDVLAACLGAGDPLLDALSRLETAGGEASRWGQRIRGFVRPGSSVEGALYAARVIDAGEHAILALASTPAAQGALLHALTVRCRRRDSLRRAILRGLLGPFAVAALTVVLEPLPNLIGSGPYVWPVFRGLAELGLLAAAVVAGVPAALRSPALGPRLRALCTRLPWLAWLAARQAEAELVTVCAPFVTRSEVSAGGVRAASALLAWSPLGERLRTVLAEAPESLLAKLMPHLSLATNLAIVSGTAANELGARLAARGEELAAELTAHLRLVLRVAAYALVVLLSLGSLASMLSRALPGMSLVPGAEQQELEEIMKEIDGPGLPPSE